MLAWLPREMRVSSGWRAIPWAACAVTAGCIIPLSSNPFGDDGGGGNGGDSGLVQADVGVVTGTWTDVTGNLLGQQSSCGNLSCLTTRPDKDEVIAAVAINGLWALNNGATTWTALGQGGGGASINDRPFQFLFDPQHPGTYWLAGGYGTCVYGTTDDGATLTPLGAATATHCDSVGVDFTDQARQTLLAGGHEGHKLYLSRNGGSSWNDISSSVPSSAGNTGFVTVLGHDEFLLGTYDGTAGPDGGPGDGIFRSTDGGAHWTLVHGGGVRSVPLISSVTKGTIYWVLYSGENQSGIVESTDNGATWERIPGSGPVISSDGMQEPLVEMPDGRLIAMTSEQTVIVSADHGASWTTEGPKIPVNPDGVAYSSFQKAIYVWHFDCSNSSDPVMSQAVLRLDFR